MSDQHEMLEKNEVGELSNELTYRHYLMGRGKIREFFGKMTIPEYIALNMIAHAGEHSSIYSGRTYLKELSEKMQLTIRQTSKMVGELQDRGLLCWSHDGNGSEGTYVTITEAGQKLLSEQETVLKEYYGRVIEKFGKKNMIDLLQLMKQLDTVMSSEVEEMEATGGDDRIDGIDG
ncbi:MAG: MarR family winged helix-turn-helix transcriptional regulator [Lachnospiraceae bacterium]|nr:MarR family winged helix-turn-helix transcriptional regulator [Robinsoniella sp.]MDY3766726.1 MarR family winged helix-turn-helix transcriptional regulator [Lachnospiraceae bacterium]